MANDAEDPLMAQLGCSGSAVWALVPVCERTSYYSAYSYRASIRGTLSGLSLCPSRIVTRSYRLI